MLLASLAGQAGAQTCHSDAVQNLDSSGNRIVLSSGQRFQVFPGQNTRAIMWQPQDKLTVCQLGGAAVIITNISPGRKNTSVKALRQN